MSTRIVRLSVPLILLLCATLLVGCAAPQRQTARVQGFVYVSAGWHPAASFGVWVFPDRLPPGQAKRMGLVPFPGCVVRVMGTGLMAVADADGFFVLVNVPFGEHSLLFGFGDMQPALWIFRIGGPGVFRGHYHGFMHPREREDRDHRGERGHRGRGHALLDSQAVSDFVRAHEAEPHSGEVLAALASGTDILTGSTMVSVPAEGWDYARQEDKDRAARLCDEWNRVVLKAREEAGFEDKVTATTRVCDTSGRVLLSRSAE